MNDWTNYTLEELETLRESLGFEIEKKHEERERKIYKGDYFEAYYHSAHKAWAVRINAKYRKDGSELWIGLYDTREYACMGVDGLDEAINNAKSESRRK